MQEQGIVFNIQRFSTHDGPGIRTTVFLKGCPLACKWCANPESQDPRPQLMTRDIKCTGCSACVLACPRQAIRMDEAKNRIIDWSRCDRCFQCVDACLYGALSASGAFKTPQNVLETVLKDQVFYKNSGGGVTVSGGEPLVQHAFLHSLLESFKREGLHAALDTTGFAPPLVLEKILPLVDLVLFDIKHLDPDRHKELTGVDNSLILESAHYAAFRNRTWFRIPLISGINDSVEHVEAVADLAKSWGVEKVSFLPFHEGGLGKWRQIGKPAPDFQGETPDQEHMEKLREIVSGKGLAVGIGS